jgi:hypothetical protein
MGGHWIESFVYQQQVNGTVLLGGPSTASVLLLMQHTTLIVEHYYIFEHFKLIIISTVSCN